MAASVIAGGLAIVADRFSIPILGPLYFLLSPVASFVIGRVFGVRYGLLTVATYGIHQFFWFGSATHVLLLAAESVVVTTGTRRGRSPALVDLTFWLIVGVPATWAVMRLVPGAAPEAASNVLPILLKLPVNGFLCVVLANAIAWIPAVSRAERSRSSTRLGARSSLRSFLFDFLVLSMVVPVVALLLTWVHLTIDSRHDQAVIELEATANETEKQLSAFLSTYLDAISTLACQLDHLHLTRAAENELLGLVHEQYPGFTTMVLADADADVYGASPGDMGDPLSFTLSDRSYFREAQRTGQVFLSEVFLGRGFGTDPIVAVSAPLYGPQGAFRGIVEGSLDLYRFDRFGRGWSSSQGSILIADRTGRTVFSSKALCYSFLDPVEIIEVRSELGRRSVRLGCGNQSQVFYASQRQTSEGWLVLALRDVTLDDRLVWDRLTLGLVGFLLAILVIAGVAQLASRLVAAPLADLAADLAELELAGDDGGRRLRDEWRNAPVLLCEVAQVIESLDEARERLRQVHASEQALLAEKVAAEKANEATSQFLSRVSHELRTPMNAILGVVQLLQTSNHYAENAQELSTIERAGAHMVDLINDVLDLSRIQAGEEPLELGAVPLIRMVEDCLALLQDLASARGIRLLLRRTRPDPWVRADPTRLRQVLFNLIENAIKYGKEGGRVEVQVQRIRGDRSSAPRVVIAVRDDGRGIPLDQRSRLFEPFHRTKGAVESGIGGTGLGLAVSRGLVERMGGRLDLDPAVTEGCRFRVELIEAPSISESSARSEPMTEEGIEGPCHILYAEDDDVGYLVVEVFLQRTSSVTVERVASVREAYARLGDEPSPDLVISDLSLPDGTGYEVLEVVRERLGPDIPVIALTANAMKPERDRALGSSFSAYVTKPVDLPSLASLIGELMRARMRSSREAPDESR